MINGQELYRSFRLARAPSLSHSRRVEKTEIIYRLLLFGGWRRASSMFE